MMDTDAKARFPGRISVNLTKEKKRRKEKKENRKEGKERRKKIYPHTDYLNVGSACFTYTARNHRNKPYLHSDNIPDSRNLARTTSPRDSRHQLRTIPTPATSSARGNKAFIVRMRTFLYTFATIREERGRKSRPLHARSV